MIGESIRLLQMSRLSLATTYYNTETLGFRRNKNLALDRDKPSWSSQKL